jgi:hypothetical protein
MTMSPCDPKTRRVAFLAVCAVASLATGGAALDPRTPEDPYEKAAVGAMDFWGDWAAGQLLGTVEVEAPCSFVTAAEGRVLIWYAKGSSSSKLKTHSEKAVKAFDALFAASPHVEGSAPRTAVLFELAGPKSFASVTAYAGAKLPHLSAWAQTATQGTGFLLEDPLAAGWLHSVPKREVWSPENELVNRLARLLMIERFGRQPQWLAQGLAWHVELEVCKDVYCFPFREGFVSKKEHKSWPQKLTSLMAARGDRPIEMGELTGWRRNTWDDASAALAWGAATMLAEHYEAELPRVLAAFAALRTKEGRNTAADGSWTSNPDYEIPAERELEILDRELGTGFLTELTRFAGKPGSYRRPR